MRASVLSIVGGGLLLTATSYAAAVERGPAPKVVSFPIEAVSDPVSVNEKRDKTVSLDIDNKVCSSAALLLCWLFWFTT